MRSSALALLAAATAVLRPVGALTPAQIISNINTLTSMSLALQQPAQSVTLLNGPLVVVGLGPFPTIITGFSNIISTASADITAMTGSPPITVLADETAVFNALNDFVVVHQQLLSILIGKAGLFTDVPFIGAPIAAALRGVEGVVDQIATMLISMLADETSQLQTAFGGLDSSLNQAISAYSGIALKKRRNYEYRA